MRIYKIIILILLLLFQLRSKGQQNAYFGQYMFNQLYINPAYAGYKEELYLQSFYRAQWVGVKGAPRTMSISADAAVSDQDIGIGGIISSDKIGAQNMLNAYANLAYRIKLDPTETKVFAFGMGVGIFQSSLNGSLLQSDIAGDPTVPSGYINNMVPDAKAGVFYSTERFFAGLSADNLLAPYLIRDRSNPLLRLIPKTNFYMSTGILLDLNRDFMFRPSLLVKTAVKNPATIDLNAFLLYRESLWAGLSYSRRLAFSSDSMTDQVSGINSLGVVLELFVKKNLRIGYSYDYSMNALGSLDYGSHEVSIGYYFLTAKSRRPRCFF